MTMIELQTLLGWTLLINVGVLLLISLIVMTAPTIITSVHRKLLPMSPQQISVMYVYYIAGYKLLVSVFNVAPYLALVIINQ